MIDELIESASFWEHIEDLRKTFIKILWTLMIGTVLGFIFHQSLINFLTSPLHDNSSPIATREVRTHVTQNLGTEIAHFTLPERALLKNVSSSVRAIEPRKFYLPPQSFIEWEQTDPIHGLIVLSPTEGFVSSLKISFWFGLLATSPLWIFFIFQFIAPALLKQEKSLVMPFLILSLFFITLGVVFAYKLTIPLANHYLFSFNASLGLNSWSLSNYIDYSLMLLLSHGLAFELFAVLIIFIHYGWLRASTLVKRRKHFIVVAFIIGAILTPPDIFSQLLMAVPMIVLFELTIVFAKLTAKRNKPLIAVQENS